MPPVPRDPPKITKAQSAGLACGVRRNTPTTMTATKASATTSDAVLAVSEPVRYPK